jgi:signal transduction histidine kinase/ligand-binding sensor domain-containing protein/ActR/RegA family two-component response regulator
MTEKRTLPSATRGEAHGAWRFAHSANRIIRFAPCALRYPRTPPQKLLFIFVLFLFFSLFSPVLFSQGYLVHHYTEMDGLPTANVHDLTQDHQGRIWFATRGGIAVYDGVSWEKYTLADGLPVLSFHHIKVDQKGRIWALSRDLAQGIILVYNKNPDGNVRSPWQQIKGKAAGNNPEKPIEITSFQLVEPKQQDKTGQPIIAVGTANWGIFLWYRGSWKNLTEDSGLLSNSVNGLAPLEGKLYAATDKGLSIINIHIDGTRSHRVDIDIDNRINQLLDLPSREIKGIGIQYRDKYPDTRLKYSRVWLYSHQWLGYFERNNPKMTLYPVKIPLTERQYEVHLLPDYRCGIYVSNRISINYFNYNNHSWEPFSMKSGLMSVGANSMLIDFEKNIWVPCERGVNKISSRRFRNLHMIHGLLDDEVSAVLEFEPGKFVLGHNGGFTLYDENTETFIKIPIPQNKSTHQLYRALDMQMDPRGNVWLAMAWAGLGKFNPRTIRYPHQITWYGKTHGLSDYIISLWIDKNTGNMWVGTDKGIFFRKNTDAEHERQQGFPLMNMGKFPLFYARRIHGDSGKLRYIASPDDGLYVYIESTRGNQWKNYQVPGDNKANNVYAIKKDSSGRLLVGALAGLLILENETLKKFKHNGFQVDRPVYFILEDKKNRLWIGTNNGVVRWDGKNKRTYSTREGLSGLETNRAAGIVDSKGRAWIGTNRGVSIYEEGFDEHEGFQPQPKVQLLTLEAPGKRIPLTGNQPVQLAYNENNIGFHFRGISFVNEKAVSFKHRLEEFEKEWSNEQYQHNRMIRYTNLPPGTYYFHLKAKNALGVWSSVVTSPGITILKPFYKAWWFYLLVVLAAAVVFYSISRFLSEKRHAALLEKQVEERTRQLKAAQQRLIQAQKMEAIGTLAGGIAHDFNNILGAIVGYTELALDDLAEGTRVRKNVQYVLTGAERAAELVKQILAFSRQAVQKRKPIILSTIVEDALKLLRSSLPATIEIRRDTRAKTGTILGDPTQIHQVMMNLGTNAAHAMKEKGGTLEVNLDEVFPYEETDAREHNIKPGPYLRLTVSDTGHGIPKAVMKRIFEPYFTTKKTGEGTGMGLAVVHGIVNNHGGYISVYSQPGKGTTFHVFFPEIETNVKTESPIKEKPPGGSERILLVDDEASLAEVGTQMLERLGYEVQGISNPIDALETFREKPNRFQLVISDLTMPHMTGLQLTEEIKKINPDTPIILCSGYSASLTAEQIDALGISAFVMKPIVKSKLAQVVRQVLDKSQKTEDR